MCNFCFQMATLKFISLTHILMDIIPIVSKLNLFFQREITDIALIKVQIDHCISDLKRLLDSEGAYQSQLNEALSVSGEHSYKEHHIARCPVSDIASTKRKFILKLVENIEARYQDFSMISYM
ncbi:uncharacterized protein LOC144622835 [Crassostrea virginica]